MWRRIALTMLASGCLLFPSVDDLTGGGDASVADVASDALVPDVSDDVQQPANDGGIDGASDADAQVGPFCAQHPTATFCADFDENANVATGFSSTYLTDGGVVSRDTTLYATAPAALLAGDTVLVSSDTSHGALIKSTGITPSSSLTFDFDYRIDKLATQGTYIESLALVFQAAVRSSVQLNVKAASSEVGEEIVALDGGKTYVAHAFPTPLPQSKWMHVKIELALKNPRTITVTVDSSVVVNAAPLNASFSNGPVDLYLGNAYAPGPSDGATIHYDDALLVIN